MSSNLMELGIVGCFDSIVDMRGEDDAVIHAIVSDHKPINLDSEDDDGESSDEKSNLESENNTTTSYSELQFYSQQLAAVLYHRFGLRSGHLVLLVCRFHVDAEIVAMLASMRIGAVFVPIDSDWLLDEKRIADIISDAKPWMAIIVGATDQDPAVLSFARHGLYRYSLLQGDGSLSSAELSVADVPEDTPEREALNDTQRALFYPCLVNSSVADDDYPLYVMYTSGSTGKPKGVIGGHRGLINRIAFQYKHFPYQWGEVSLRRTSAIFIDALVEIYAPLLAGVPILACSSSMLEEGDVTKLIRVACNQQEAVTRMTLLPSQLGLILELLSSNDLSLLSEWRYVNISGEPCTRALVEKFNSKLPNCTLVNFYGSTEVAGDVTFAILTNESSIDDVVGGTTHIFSPIGRPIENNHVFVVEEVVHLPGNIISDRKFFKQVALDEPGELLVYGCHVAGGYYKRDKETAERFLIDPVIYDVAGANIDLNSLSISDTSCFEDEDSAIGDDSHAKETRTSLPCILFRMGDIVVQNSSQILTWLGRRDFQIKIRGVRLELEEAEARIVTTLGAGSADVALVAVSMNRPSSGQLSEDKQLVLFVEEAALDRLAGAKIGVVQACEMLKTQLISKLPSLYVPTSILSITSIPRNVSGKVDRNALVTRLQTQLLSTSTSTSTSTSISNDETFNQKHSHVNQPTDQDSHLQQLLAILFDILPLLSAKEEIINNIGSSHVRLLARSFLELGGDSMTAIVFGWRLRECFGAVMDLIQKDLLEWPVKKIFDHISSSLLSSNKAQHLNYSAIKEVVTEVIQYVDLSSTSISAPELFSSALLEYKSARIKSLESHKPSVDSSHSLPSLRNIWSHGLLRCVDATPVLIHFDAHSVAYIGSHGGDFAAVDVHSGMCIWRILLGSRVEAAALFIEAHMLLIVPSYSATDVEGTVNNVRSDGLIGTLFGLDSRTGAVVWQTGLNGELKSSAVLDPITDSIFIGCYGGTLHRVAAATGVIIGKINLGGPIYSTPVLIDSSSSRIWVATIRGLVYCLHMTNSGDPEVVWQVDISSPIYSSLRLVDNKLIFGCVDGSIRVLNALTGVLWGTTNYPRPIFSTPCLFQDNDDLKVIFGSHDGYIRCVSISGAVESVDDRDKKKRPRKQIYSPKELPSIWSKHLGAIVFSSPVLSHIGSRPVVIVCTTAGLMFVLDTQTGDEICQIELPAEIFSSPVVVDDFILVGCRDDKLHCLRIGLS